MFHFRKKKKRNKTDNNVPAQQKDFLCKVCKSLNLSLQDLTGKTKGARQYEPEPSGPDPLEPSTRFVGGENFPLCRLVVTTEYYEQEQFAGGKAWHCGPILGSEKITVKLIF